MRSPAKCAATSIHVASAYALKQVSGQYFANSVPKQSSAGSYDEFAAARLWNVSVALVRLSATPPPDPVGTGDPGS